MESPDLLDPNCHCRLCVADLTTGLIECYCIEEDVERLILELTTISFEDIDNKHSLLLCVTCFGRLKAFESYRDKCINNQQKFKTLKSEDPEVIEEASYIEYIEDEIDEEQFIEDAHESSEPFEKSEQEGTEEMALSLDNILDEEIDTEEIDTATMDEVIIMPPVERSEKVLSKGKELYQKLLQQCQECSKMIEKNRMEGHMNKHRNVRPFTCPECQKKFYCKQLLRLHRTSIHTNILIKCETCDKLFPSQRALYAHSLRHKNRDKYQCELCEKKFNNTNSLKRHMAVHSGIRDFVCTHCGVGFYRKFNLDTHIKNVHQEIKDYICTYDGCEKKFGYARLLRDHIKKHHAKNYAEEEY